MDKKELLKNKLFQPLKIKNFVLKNRFVLAPMALNTSTDDGIITDDDLAYAQRRSHSAPMAITGGTYINKYAQLFENGFANDRDEVLPGLTQMAKVMKKDGNLAILQIAHSWRFSIASLIRYKKVYGPSAGVFLTPFEHEVTELTIEEIEGIIQDFENAVLRAIKAGFDGVEIASAQRLLQQAFFSKYSNQRKDKYGNQSLESRALLTMQVLHRVQDVIKKHAHKDFILGFRATPEETIGEIIGYSVEEFNWLMDKILDEIDISYLSLASWGKNIYKTKVRTKGKFYNQLINKVVYEHINGRVPVIANGGINSLESAIEAIEHVDLVGLSTVFVVEPEFVQKLMEKKENQINLDITKANLEDLKIPPYAFKNIAYFFDFGQNLPESTSEVLKENSQKKD